MYSPWFYFSFIQGWESRKGDIIQKLSYTQMNQHILQCFPDTCLVYLTCHLEFHGLGQWSMKSSSICVVLRKSLSHFLDTSRCYIIYNTQLLREKKYNSKQVASPQIKEIYQPYTQHETPVLRNFCFQMSTVSCRVGQDQGVCDFAMLHL